MRCAACEHENRPDRRYCSNCGGVLEIACPHCGTANEAGDRFCGGCGAELGRPARDSAVIASPSEAERRVVSVLFADLVGFTPLSESLDPEHVRDLMGRYFEVARDVIERHGGMIEKFIGDAVVAVWGAPVAQEDDAERAVRAALEVVDAVVRLGEVTKIELAARAAVSTGAAAVTIGARGQGLVTGDLVNTTARMQAVAEPGWVLMDGATRRITESAIGSAAAGTFELKGKREPVELHRATRVLANRRGEGRYAGVEPPFVGRGRELRLVKELFHATEADRRAHLVHVGGLPGLGKTRLSWEFEKYADGLADTVLWHRGRCLSYGDGVAFWALAEMVRGRARILEDDSPEQAARKLAHMLDEQVADVRTREWVGPALEHLLGLEDSGTAIDRSRLFSGWRMFFEHLSGQGTVVLVFEDMQWADEALLDFVEYLLEWSRSHPVFVLALARPELNERRPGWAASRGLTALPLEPLAEEAMCDMVAGMVPGLPRRTVELIASRADGTPLYAVETVRMLLDRGLLRRTGEAYEPTGSLDQLDIPESLQSLVAARLDALTRAERRLVQRAAVLGKSFTIAGLAAITETSAGEVRELLEALAHKDIVQVLTDPFSAERGQYTFVQSTLRTVAYEQISHRDRKPLHLAVATHLAGLEESTDLSEVIAAHLFDAYRLAPDDPDAGRLRERAREMLLSGADRASSVGAPEEALRLVLRAVDLAEPDHRAGLLERAGMLAVTAERMTRAGELLQASLELYEAVGADHPAARVRCRIGDVLFLSGRSEEAVDMLDRAYAALAGQTPDEDIAVLAAQVGRIRALSEGPTEHALAPLDHALRVAEDLGLPPITSDALNTKALILLQTRGRREEGRSLLWGALRVAEQSGSNAATLRAQFNLAYDRHCEDRLAESIELDRQGLELARRLGDRQWEISFVQHLMNTLFQTLEWDELETLMETPRLRSGESHFASASMWGLAAILAHRGDLEGAERMFGSRSIPSEISDPQSRALWIQWRSLLELARGNDLAVVQTTSGIASADVLGVTHPLRKYPVVLGAVSAARLGDPRAQELVDLVATLPASERTPLYVAAAHRVRALLGDDPDREFAAAEAIFDATAFRWELAETLLDHAHALARQDRHQEMEEVIDRALTLYGRAGATVRAAELEELRQAQRPQKAQAG
jgi:class 3 adenylate cyclase/tetratricopeptide (TPR) repeat protein